MEGGFDDVTFIIDRTARMELGDDSTLDEIFSWQILQCCKMR
jgi:hypothetical protein